MRPVRSSSPSPAPCSRCPSSRRRPPLAASRCRRSCAPSSTCASAPSRTTVVTLRWTDRSARERRYEIAVGTRVVRLAPNARTYRDRPPGRASAATRVRACLLAALRRVVGRGRGGVADPPPAPGSEPTLGGCPMFPADNPWNTRRRRAAACTATPPLRRRHLGRGRPLPAPRLRLATRAYGIPFVIVPGDAAASCRSASSTTATRAIPARTRSRSTRRSRAARDAARAGADQQGSCRLYELFDARRAGARLGRRAPARSSTCAPTRCGPTRGRRPTPRACRSCPASCATTRCGRRDPPRAARHRAAHAARASSTRRRTTARRDTNPDEPADGPAPAPARRLRRRAATTARRA